MQTLKKKTKKLLLVLLLATMMLLISSCRTSPKAEEKEIPAPKDEVYFPAFPDAYKDGKHIPEFFKVVIDPGGQEHEDVYVIPEWYWVQVILYAYETECAVQALYN